MSFCESLIEIGVHQNFGAIAAGAKFYGGHNSEGILDSGIVSPVMPCVVSLISLFGARGKEGTPRKIGWGCVARFPYPIYDQNLRFSLP